MKIVSVNIGQPRTVEYNGEMVVTGIYKEPVFKPVKVNELTLAGDIQVDRRFHGGANKAVYAYPSEHYEFWRTELPEMDLPFGTFGENLTTIGVLETEICVGDKIRVGTAELIATEPRFPCYKLGIKFGRKDIIRRFQKSRRSGIYFSVFETGELQTGDNIEFLERDENRVTIEDLVRLNDEKNNIEIAKRALKVIALPKDWKRKISKMLG
ncbi:MAG: MOSC domain-containing protein [Pyrinomonadaceae bacterium]